MNAMKPSKHVQALEQALLSHVEMCYSVALALTRNPVDARDLTRETLTWAWHVRNGAQSQLGVKMMLLNALRERFLKDHRRVPCSPGNDAALAKTV